MLTTLKRTLLFCAALVIPFQSAQSEEIILFSAATLQNAIDEINVTFENAHPGTKIVASYNSASNLSRQIVEGAPAHLFISANERWMNYLAENDAIDPESRAYIVKNELAVITHKDNPDVEIDFNSKSFWEDALKNTRLAIGDPDHVPGGMYVKESFTNLGIWDVVERKVAASPTIRAALVLVERKESDLGIVYLSDVVISDKVKILAKMPEGVHAPIDFPIALVGKNSSEMAKTYYHYLLSDESKAVFKKHGFSTP